MACTTCIPLPCDLADDLALYSVASAAPRTPLRASAPVINCRTPDDLGAYSLQSGYFFTNIEYHFVFDCPPGYTCLGGPTVPITIPPGVIVVTVPNNYVGPDGTLATPFTQTLTCCNSPVQISAPVGSTLTQIADIINAAFAACARATAACLVGGSPGVNPGTPNHLTLAAPANACAGVAYSSRMISTGATGRIQWFITSGALPPGLILEDQTGFTPTQTQSMGISGNPSIAGNYPFTILIADTLGHSITKNFTISVLGITNSPPNGTVGSAYSFQFTAAGGTAPYTFSVLAAALPDGLTMSASGLITGTPENDTPCSPIFTVTDSA